VWCDIKIFIFYFFEYKKVIYHFGGNQKENLLKKVNINKKTTKKIHLENLRIRMHDRDIFIVFKYVGTTFARSCEFWRYAHAKNGILVGCIQQ
jgi:hypothetical protein